jgi:hypothetical protein
MVSLETSTGILLEFAYHFTGETPILLSLAFANVASMLSMKYVCQFSERLASCIIQRLC